ncbi:Rpb4 family DNA-directed RNA polymerase subunit, partial [Klebsiella pneumoniae]|nr:Rpb4 family DNA-directed RNA polymerase subunit [Klebsiella pneumoniae]
DERILVPLEEKYKEMIKSGEKSEKDALKALEREQETKGLSEVELLQIYNLAPQAVEILQNIVVDWEDRFSPEEMDVIVQVITEVF